MAGFGSFDKLVVISAAAAALMVSVPASAASRHHHAAHHSAGVSYDNAARQGGGYQTMVSDGPGTGFGFHRLPGPYRVAATVHRDRQAAAVRSAVVDDALTSGSSQ